MHRLYEIAMDHKSHPMASVAAGREILDRTYGKAAQPQITLGMDLNSDGTDMSGLTALLMRARMSKSEQAKKIVTDADFVASPNGHAYAAKPADEPGEASPAQAAPPPEQPEPVILKRAPDPAQSEQPKPKPQPKPEAPTLKTDPELKPQPQPSVSYARVPGTNRVKRVP